MGYRVAVVGGGFLGAAVTEYFSRSSGRITGFIARYGHRDKYYSSHEDDSRMVRLFHSDPYWSTLTMQNIEDMRSLQQESGINFFYEVPVIYHFGAPVESEFLCDVHSSSKGFEKHLRGAVQCQDVNGGYLDPRHYIDAMFRMARQRGAEIRQDPVLDVRRRDSGYLIRCESGWIGSADVVFDLRGVFSDTVYRVCEVSVVKKILLYTEKPQIDPALAFCFIDSAPSDLVFADCYVFVNYRKENEKTYSKVGFSESSPTYASSAQELVDWFRGEYLRHPLLERAKEYIEGMLTGDVEIVEIKPCAFAATASGRPVVLRDGNYVSILGCNGALAKCCQAFVRKVVKELWL